ncbi:MAG: YibE/F family protein [Patescibacteria group bacterium]
MNNFLTYIKFFLSAAVFLFFIAANSPVAQAQDAPVAENITFEAEVVKILEQRQFQREDGSNVTQQNILLRGLTGEFQGREVEFHGISEVDVFSANAYEIGDQVLVQQDYDLNGQEKFYIQDYVRRGYIYVLAGLFAVFTVIIGGKKGLRSLLSLIVSYLIIMYFILPRILSGSSPLIVGIIGVFLILAVIIYLTEGLGRKSHVAIASVLASLIVTFVISYIFTKLTRLSGMAQEESVFLTGIAGGQIDFRGLLLAGILIGTAGVLDDVIVGQIEAVEQLRTVNQNLSKKETFKAAYKIGNTHLGAIVNTLFLTYTGASLPLLLLFSVNEPPFLTIREVLNHELIATEIVRTLVGSIGVALSLPIATVMSVYLIKNKKSAVASGKQHAR